MSERRISRNGQILFGNRVRLSQCQYLLHFLDVGSCGSRIVCCLADSKTCNHPQHLLARQPFHRDADHFLHLPQFLSDSSVARRGGQRGSLYHALTIQPSWQQNLSPSEQLEKKHENI